MGFIATPEQEAIIGGDLVPQCVIACPGSGKTVTAVRRLVEVRRRLGDSHGYVALFSYSNVAVDTFKQEFGTLLRTLPGLSQRVLIGTVDSFLTTYVLRPHGARTMGASRSPFLVHGTEPFLRGFTVFDGKYPHPISELRVQFKSDGTLEYLLQAAGKPPVPVEAWKAQDVIEKLGKAGAYTHELGRYWALRALAEKDWLLQALCYRFPHILVDEAQDVGPLHGALLDALAGGGSTVSLIGDPNQGIYEFAGADGSFLREYGTKPKVVNFSLSQNRRSVNSIVNVANHLAGAGCTPIREPGPRRHGAFHLPYDEDKLDDLMATFAGILEANQYDKEDAVVVCRGNSTVQRLTGGQSDIGVGATGLFARAAIFRDRGGDIAEAFRCVVDAFVRLIENAPNDFKQDVLTSTAEGSARQARRLLWEFLRSPAEGLPAATLQAKSTWHPQLKARVEALLEAVESQTDIARSQNWGRNLTIKDLPDKPLWETDLVAAGGAGIRVDTVHQVKGEGVTAVLYLARTADINKLVEGTTTEDGRIGYVAVTRARDLLLLAVPNTAKKALLQAIESKGFEAWVE
ncbi:MAG: ATP-dependent helicase [Ralstonia sp.]|jgi:superfamily I DNA/RNA helicase|uniref:DNA 3'-5' helicase II n=2 Tax=Ralstonia pickettii TaxID=329 RepID=A0AAW4Q7E9_RALPI|nr:MULTISPECIES: ATP-dependent helicase [Ralstonia]MBX3754285.1 ATP-dependent helicase [Ralstonia pickettii]MBX3768037.1 ATP-dependent helicase [Ralstonia pickettii]MBX3777813.1 ATP-dependent helicase [Ralstonia pickettii]MBX3783066.1 ATP-dependent helicase [Ralstonia pickettii]MBX3790612.1 ATP-dependent helicase [Ralstonia pickettii]